MYFSFSLHTHTHTQSHMLTRTSTHVHSEDEVDEASVFPNRALGGVIAIGKHAHARMWTHVYTHPHAAFKMPSKNLNGKQCNVLLRNSFYLCMCVVFVCLLCVCVCYTHAHIHTHTHTHTHPYSLCRIAYSLLCECVYRCKFCFRILICAGG